MRTKESGATDVEGHQTEPQDTITVSIIIKALNEEQHIETAIRSALAAIRQIGGEVILADSLSTDATMDIAGRHPIAIVQLRNPADRRCGAGPQLGYQVARGRYIYILDGDMELHPRFLPAALAAMESDPELGGVAGLVEEKSTSNYQFRRRKRRNAEATAGEAGWLDMGGLYRRRALEQAGYFANRNLHAYEEQDLGLRLIHAGWRLRRLDVPGVAHHGRTENSLALLIRRWRTRYLDGGGEILRASLGKPYFLEVLLYQKHIIAALALWCGLVAGLFSPFYPWLLIATTAVIIALVAIRAARTGSLSDSLFAQLVWQVTALATIRGFVTPQLDPATAIEFVHCKAPDRTTGTAPRAASLPGTDSGSERHGTRDFATPPHPHAR